MRERGNLNWNVEICERNPQIEERGPAANDEFAVEWIDIRQASRAIGTDQKLVADDHKSPWLGIVARRSENRVTDREARLVQCRSLRRKARWINIPRGEIGDIHNSLPVHYQKAEQRDRFAE